MRDHYTILGLFNKVDTLTKAVDPVIEQFDLGNDDVEVLTSAAYPDGALIDDKPIEFAVDKRQYLFPFILGLCGMGLGIFMAGGTGYIMNLVVGGKEPFAYAPIGIVTYEFTLGFAVIGSFLSLLYFTGLPNWTERAYDPEITDGAMGLLIKVGSVEDQERAVTLMESLGAYRTKKGENDF